MMKTKTATKTRIDTIDFQSAHAKMPRGTGSWAFATSRQPKSEDIFWVNSNYGEAKRQAREHFGKLNAHTAFLLS